MAALVLGALVAISSSALAQNAGADKQGKQGKGGTSVERQLERMTKSLELTDAQKPKVKALLEDISKKREELRSNTNQSERREKMRALMEDEQKKLKEILTADQFKKWEQQREEMRKNAKSGGGKKKSQ